MPIDQTYAAKAAYETARKEAAEENVSFPGHFLDLAETLVPLGITYLTTETGFDPDTDATTLATDAVVQYVVARLLGHQVSEYRAFQGALRIWREAAARQAAVLGALDAWDPATIAAAGAREALRGQHADPTAQDLVEAAIYVDAFVAQAVAETGYDPLTQATAIATQAAVHFVRSKLQGAKPENDDAYTEAYRRWRLTVARDTEANTYDPSAPRDLGQLAKMALQQATRSGRKEPTAQDVAEATQFATMALGDLQASSNYDPAVRATVLADQAIVEYTRLSLLGGIPGANKGYLALKTLWQQGAARENYRNYPDDADTFLGVPRRVRSHTSRTLTLRDPE